MVVGYNYPLKEIDDMGVSLEISRRIKKRLLGIRKYYKGNVMTFYFEAELDSEEKSVLDEIYERPPKIYRYSLTPSEDEIKNEIENLIGVRPMKVILDNNNRPVELCFDTPIDQEKISTIKRKYYNILG